MPKLSIVLPVIAGAALGTALSVAPSALAQACSFSHFTHSSSVTGNNTTNLLALNDIRAFNNCPGAYQSVSNSIQKHCVQTRWRAVTGYLQNATEIAEYINAYAGECYNYVSHEHFSSTNYGTDNAVNRGYCTIGNTCS
jgi:hypothetical protein